MLKLINWSPNNEGSTHQQREAEAMQKGKKRQQRMAA